MLLSSPLLLAQVSPVALSHTKQVVPAFDSSGPITLEASGLKADIAYPQGKKERRDLTVVFDPKRGFYLWHSAPSDSNDSGDTGIYLKLMRERRAVVFAGSEGLTSFLFGRGLFVKSWRGRAQALDAAVSASNSDIRQGLAVSEGRGYHGDYKFVPVFGQVPGLETKVPPEFKPLSPEGFACEPDNAFCPSDNNTIASVSKEGSQWRLILRNRFDVEVILDQDFDLVSARQLTQPK